MKKTLIIAALAAVLVLALGATPAFAKYAGYSSSKQYVPWTEAQSLASLNPDAAVMASGPHAGYATTTIKCAVCHSVHRGTNNLLNSGTACAYCHTESYWGGAGVASNTISWYAGPGGTYDGTGAGPHSSCASSYCHGGPHGVGASEYAGPASKLLTHLGDANLDAVVAANVAADPTLAVDLGTYDATTRALATGAVCGRSGCHSNSMFGVVAPGAAATLTTPAATVTGHRVVAAATGNWNDKDNNNVPDKTTFNTNVTGTIAYAAVEYCNSCHDLVDDNNSGKAAFPHAINGVVDAAAGADGTWRVAVWLTAGAYAGDTSRAAVGTYSQYNITARGSSANPTQAAISSAAGSTILDGVCLKCHKGAADSGLGFNY